MNAELIIFTKAGEVLAMCYSPGCSKAKSYVEELPTKGYEVVNVVAKPIQCSSADSVMEFSIRAANGIEIRPQDHSLQIKRVKPEAPFPLTFRLYSAAGEAESVTLVIKHGGMVDEEAFEVTCKKRQTSSPAGANTTALISGGAGHKVQMDNANVKVVGSESHSNPTTHHYHGDVNSDKRQTRIAQNMADSGGQITVNQHGGKNTQNIAKQ